MNLLGVALSSMVNELVKIAQNSHPGIIAPPTPGGDGGMSTGTPARPITSRGLIGKVVNRTNLQKTNYTAPSTETAQPNDAVTSGQHALTPPPVTV